MIPYRPFPILSGRDHPVHIFQVVTTSQHSAEGVLSTLEQEMRSYLRVLSRTGLFSRTCTELSWQLGPKSLLQVS